MIPLPVKRGSQIHVICYFGVFAFIILSYLLSPADFTSGKSIYYLVLSQIFFGLGMYCLLPKNLHHSLDIGPIGFALIPLIVNIIASVVLGFLFGVSLGDSFNGNTYVEIYWLSILLGLISAIVLYFLVKKAGSNYDKSAKAWGEEVLKGLEDK